MTNFILDQANENQAKAINPHSSVWVSASAGTGKTKVLTDRVLALLLSGTLPQRILCLTFTKAAAAEMSNRLLSMLSKWTIAPDEVLIRELTPLLAGHAPSPDHLQTARQLFARVLDVPGGMHIETIHAFCQSLLRRFPVEAGLSPHFQVMDDTDAKEILAEIQLQVLARAQSQTQSDLAQALKHVTDRIHETRFGDLLTALTRNRGQIARMLRSYNGLEPAMTALGQRLGLLPGDNQASILTAACDEANFDGPALRLAVTTMLNGKTTDQGAATVMAAWLSTPDQRAETFADYALAYLTQTGEPRKKLPTKDICLKYPQIQEAFSAEAQRLIAIHNRLKAVETRDSTQALLTLGQAILHAYGLKKDRLATLDYDDLIFHSRSLLEQTGISAWVLYKLDGGIDHVLIDEAQDTNPDQWAVIRALTTEFFAGLGGRDAHRTIFAVGDAKQSIYSFQRADPAEFAAMRHYFEQKVTDCNHHFANVNLLVSFRSTQSVLAAVNAIFAPGFAARDGVASPQEDIDHLAARQGQSGIVEVWPPVPVRASTPPDAWKPPIERIRADSPSQRLCSLMAERIDQMIGKIPLPSRNRPIRAGDIMVLVRRRGAFVEDLIRALKTRSIAVAGADRMVLTDQIAVMDLIALGEALLQPQDDLTLATVLKSPLIGLDEDQLYDLAYGRPGTLWDCLRHKSETSPHFAVAWDRLSRWQNQADRMTPFEFFSAILGAEGGRQRLSARLGPEADDPLDEFLTLALTFQQGHPPSLQGFLHWLNSAGIEIKRDLEQGTIDAVRIMTVHGSKGLQAPIVFLPDTMQVPQRSTDPLYWLDQSPQALMTWPPSAKLMDMVSAEIKQARDLAQQHEYHRLLYVAATRAEDQLIVCGWSGRNGSTGNWHDAIQTALAPSAAQVEDPILARLQETETADILQIKTPQTAPPDRTGKDHAERQTQWSELPEWVQHPPAREPAPPKPLAPSRPSGDEPVVRSPLNTQNSAISYRRGTFIHRLLQTLPNLPVAERSGAAQRYLTKAAPDWDAAQRVKLASEVLDILENEKFKDLFGRDSLAEVPVAGLIGSKAIAGVVDRLVVTPHSVKIIDYKTNRRPPTGDDAIPEHYIRQMAAYRLALACIYPNHKIHCALVWTDGPFITELDNKALDDALD